MISQEIIAPETETITPTILAEIVCQYEKYYRRKKNDTYINVI